MRAFARRYLPLSAQSLLRLFYYHSPVLRRLYYAPQRLFGLWPGRDDRSRPPPGLSVIGDGDFEEIGKEFLGYFIELGGLTTNDAVLDVGSGVGRMAIALAPYLNEHGRYEGFDVVPDGIRWCQQNLTPRYPRFRFQIADVRNRLYNPKGTASATEYRFPFEDGTFDFCFCTSIFTHLLPEEVAHYLAEVARVLRPGGRCLATFFLVPAPGDVESTTLQRFSGRYRGNLVTDERIPEASIAYPEADVRRYLDESGLDVVEPFHYGSWSGRKEFLSWQDVVVVRKRPSSARPPRDRSVAV